MDSRKISKAVADIERNRLHITLAGSITRDELSCLYTDVRFSVADLRPGFHVITDVTMARLVHLNGIDILLKIARYLKEKEVGLLFRVVERPHVIDKQLRRLASMVPDYTPIQVSSRSDVEVILAAVACDKPEDALTECA